MTYSEYLDELFVTSSPLGDKLSQRIQEALRMNNFRTEGGDHVNNFESAVEVASVQLACRLMRIKTSGVNTLNWDEMSELLDMASAASLQRWALRKHYPSRSAFTLLDFRLTQVESSLDLEPMTQVNPWNLNNDN